MMTHNELAALKQRIWPPNAVRPIRMYAVLDGARNPKVHELVRRSYRETCCLFAGSLDPELERAAPFLLELHPGDATTDSILLQGWADAWGIFVRTESTFSSLRRHLRTFLRVRAENGGNMLFRYYDPRVLSAFLPTCSAEQLELIFGEVILQIVVCCLSTGKTNSYLLQDGTLLTQELHSLAS